MSHSRSYRLPMLMPCQVGQNVIGGLLTLTISWLVLGLSVYPVLENIENKRGGVKKFYPVLREHNKFRTHFVALPPNN